MNKYKSFNQLTDSERQLIAEEYLITQTVYLQNETVEYILQKSYEEINVPFSYDDITNYEPSGEIELANGWVSLTEQERDELILDVENDYLYCNSDINLLEHMEFDNYPEIYQWFLCSDHLIYALEEKGECVLDNMYWGRQACGQSITLDNVIQLIAYETFTKCNWPQSDMLRETLLLDPLQHDIVFLNNRWHVSDLKEYYPEWDLRKCNIAGEYICKIASDRMCEEGHQILQDAIGFCLDDIEKEYQKSIKDS